MAVVDYKTFLAPLQIEETLRIERNLVSIQFPCRLLMITEISCRCSVDWTPVDKTRIHRCLHRGANLTQDESTQSVMGLLSSVAKAWMQG